VETVFRVRACGAGNTRPRPRPGRSECRTRARQQTPTPSHFRPFEAKFGVAAVVFLNARYLDPVLGRFMSVDPLVGLTRDAYGYGNNNPVTYSDPSGLKACDDPRNCRTNGTAPTSTISYGRTEATVKTNSSGFVTSVTRDSGFGVTDITDDWRQDAGSDADRAFLYQRNQCRYNEGSCYAAVFLLMGGSAGGAANVASAMCDACDLGAILDDPVGNFIIDAIVTWGAGRVIGAGLEGLLAGGEDAMAAVRAAGQQGETAAGIVKNSQRIPSLTGTAAYRIPDELGAGALGEVKNVASLSYTRQLRDFMMYSHQNGLTFSLYVRGSTSLSGPLQQLVDSGAINLIRSLPG
jgi:RHS repeat-associated protein